MRIIALAFIASTATAFVPSPALVQRGMRLAETPDETPDEFDLYDAPIPAEPMTAELVRFWDSEVRIIPCRARFFASLTAIRSNWGGPMLCLHVRPILPCFASHTNRFTHLLFPPFRSMSRLPLKWTHPLKRRIQHLRCPSLRCPIFPTSPRKFLQSSKRPRRRSPRCSRSDNTEVVYQQYTQIYTRIRNLWELPVFSGGRN